MADVKDQSSHSQPMHAITIELNIGRRCCEIIMKEKNTCHTKFCAFRCLISRPQKSNSEVSKSNYFFLKNYVTSEEAVILSTAFHYSLNRKGYIRLDSSKISLPCLVKSRRRRTVSYRKRGGRPWRFH